MYMAAGTSARESQIMTVNQIISLIQIIYVYSYLPSYSKLLMLKGKVEYKLSKNNLKKYINLKSVAIPFLSFCHGKPLEASETENPKINFIEENLINLTLARTGSVVCLVELTSKAVS